MKQRFNFEDINQRRTSSYVCKSIIKTMKTYFRNLQPTQNHHRFVMPFVTFMDVLSIGKIFNILEESQ